MLDESASDVHLCIHDVQCALQCALHIVKRRNRTTTALRVCRMPYHGILFHTLPHSAVHTRSRTAHTNANPLGRAMKINLSDSELVIRFEALFQMALSCTGTFCLHSSRPVSSRLQANQKCSTNSAGRRSHRSANWISPKKC